MTRLLKTPIIGPSAKNVISSWIDMLAGLSRLYIFRMPPGFWANVASPADIPTNNKVTANAQRLGFISSGLPGLSNGCPIPSLILHNRALACLLHCKSNDILSSTDPIEYREAAGLHIEQILAIGGGLPVFAHRNVRNILPQLHLELDADPPLLVQVAGVEPGGSQGFDARARRPAIKGGQPIRTYPLIAIGVGVRNRSVEKEEERVPAALVRRRL